MRNRFAVWMGMTMGLMAGTVAVAADTAVAFDPLTVKVGEEMRIQLINPTADPIEVRVFAYNAAEGTYDEGPKFVLPAGKIRFFDFKAAKEFVGIGGVIETTPDPPPATETAGARTAAGSPDRQIVFSDIVVSSVKSKGSLQHRTSNGQSQTMGYSFGATQTGSFGVKAMTRTARKETVSNWVASPEL